ncbi:MAG: outer membrane protein transport protein [Woeseiaceae bacterium]|nr:outer membrane protein transport protein [Woeseiaceae bacterium]
MAGTSDRLSNWVMVLFVLPGLSLGVGTASAQETIVPIQLSFSDPGARSMGFGGAFVALADDATAALANPSGLVQLVRPEVSIEARNWSYSTPYTNRGRVENLPSGVGIDSIAGLVSSRSKYDVEGLSFVSIAYPIGDWSLAVFQHEYADIAFAGETQGLFGGGSSCCQTRIWDQRSTSDLEISSFGLSVAYRINDKLSIGATAVRYDSSLVATTNEFLWDDDTIQSFFERSSYLPERSVRQQVLWVDDDTWSFSGGFLWTLSPTWRIGGVYRQSLDTALSVEATAGPASDFGVPPGTTIFEATGIPLEFPDIWGLGFAYRSAHERLTISFQWDRVNYSNIPRSMGVDDATIDDADELHLGAEYVFLDSTPVFAARLGMWLDPDHQMRSTADEPFVRALQPAGTDEIHFTGGVGVAMDRFQVDVAFDYSDLVSTASLSAIYNF